MLSVLLIDDEPAILDISKKFLERTGQMTVMTVKSAREGLLQMAQVRFDVIVCDYEMPEMNGVQLLRELRIHGDHTPFIIFTGKGREQIVIEALNAGATFYLEKGANPKALYNELANQILQAYNRRIAESALKENAEKYRALIEHGLEGIAILSLEGKILFANRAAARTFDIESPELLIGRSVFEFISPESRPAVDTDFSEVNRGRDAYLAMYKCTTAKGRQIWIDSIGKKITYEGSPADLISIRDVTELKRTTETLRILNRKLNLVSDIIRHDIRNKVTGIMGYMELAKAAAAGTEVEEYLLQQEPLLDEIVAELDFLRDYDTLGAKEPSMQSVASAIEPHVAALEKSGITVINDASGLVIFSDPLLERVFFNLFDNSRRHGEKVTEIRISTRKEPTGLSLLYEDNGIGIPAGQKEQVFEKGIGKNTGLGLFLIREILAITGITIRETGEPGNGVRFEMLVPEGRYAFLEKQQ